MHPNYSIYIYIESQSPSMLLSFTSSLSKLLWGQKSSFIYHFVFPCLTWCLEWEDAALISLEFVILCTFPLKFSGILFGECEITMEFWVTRQRRTRGQGGKEKKKSCDFPVKNTLGETYPWSWESPDNLSIWSSKGNLLGSITDSCGI